MSTPLLDIFKDPIFSPTKQYKKGSDQLPSPVLTDWGDSEFFPSTSRESTLAVEDDQSELLKISPSLKKAVWVTVDHIVSWETSEQPWYPNTNKSDNAISTARLKYSGQNAIWKILDTNASEDAKDRLAKHRALGRIIQKDTSISEDITVDRLIAEVELKQRMKELNIRLDKPSARKETFRRLNTGYRKNPIWWKKTISAIVDYIGFTTKTGDIESHLTQSEKEILWKAEQFILGRDITLAPNLLKHGLQDHRIAFERIMQKMQTSADTESQELLKKMRLDRKTYLKHTTSWEMISGIGPAKTPIKRKELKEEQINKWFFTKAISTVTSWFR